MKRDEIGDLLAFMAVAEEGSFTRAAARLTTSQSALSHVVRRLETRLGVRLLSRTTRKVAPTAAGERLLHTITPAFADIEGGIAAIGEVRDKPAGTIRMTTSEHAAHTILWPALTPLLREYPDLHVELSIEPAFSDIVADRFDAGIRLGESVARDMIAVQIGPELRMAVVGSPSYLAVHPAPRKPSDLAAHRCINLRLSSAGGLYAWELEKGTRALRVRVDGQLISNNMRLITRAATEGFGLACVIEDAVSAELAAGTLVRVLADWCQPFPGYHLYYPSRRQPSAAFALVVDALRYRPGAG